jgi:hypothetical protein
LCASAENNAVSSYISYDERYLDKGNCIFIGGKTFVVTYQEKDFYSNDSHNLVLYLKNEEKRNKVYQLFLAACINKSLGHKYSWGDSISNKKIQKDKVSLPIKNGEINYEFMECFMAELEVKCIAKLEAYLLASGLKNYTLTLEEQRVLEDIENGKIEWGEFRIGELFEVATGRDVIIGNVLDGDIPLISHQHDNNGISKKIAQLPNRRLFNFKNTLPLADRGVFLATNQNEDFHIGTRVKALTFKDGEKTLGSRLFFVSSINKLQILFTDYSSNATDNLPNLIISLPTQNHQLDYAIMDTFISAIQKMVIKDVVMYTDKKIATTKSVVKKY